MRSQVLHDDVEYVELQGMKHVCDELHAWVLKMLVLRLLEIVRLIIRIEIL